MILGQGEALVAATVGAATSTTLSANSASSSTVAVVLVEASIIRGSCCSYVAVAVEIVHVERYCRWYLLCHRAVAAFCVTAV